MEVIKIKTPKVYIVILNWNGWQDTIECLESVFRNNYPNYKVIVCDNASEDGSINYIKEWAAGNIERRILEDRHCNLTSSPIRKPLEYIEYSREEAEIGGDLSMDEPHLILIHTGKNLGFAGGNNVGLKYALARKDFKYVWLLNNDTVIESDALTYLVKRMEVKPAAGMCGSTLLYYDAPNTIQAMGGARYNKWLGIAKHIGAFSSFNAHICDSNIEKEMDYVVGASMLVAKSFLQNVGLMNEDYFLYYEEIDWAIRGKIHNYELAYAPDSVVYHKEGSSIGTNSLGKKQSMISTLYLNRNRIKLTNKFFKRYLPFVYLHLILGLVNAIRKREWDRMRLLFRIIFE